jgi:hypothetical protein
MILTYCGILGRQRTKVVVEGRVLDELALDETSANEVGHR